MFSFVCLIHREDMEKVNIRFHDNYTVSYQHKKILEFVPELSADRDIRITSPNIPLLVIIVSFDLMQDDKSISKFPQFPFADSIHAGEWQIGDNRKAGVVGAVGGITCRNEASAVCISHSKRAFVRIWGHFSQFGKYVLSARYATRHVQNGSADRGKSNSNSKSSFPITNHRHCEWSHECVQFGMKSKRKIWIAAAEGKTQIKIEAINLFWHSP